MNSFIFRFSSLVSGILFGLGMAVSGMIEPEKVIGFLDIAGDWDASLAFVMGGALAVFVPFYKFVIKPRKRALSGNEMCIPEQTKVDSKLVSGSALFGLGWGIAGICPGPAVTSLALGNISIVLFFVAMLVGSLMAQFLFSKADKTSQLQRKSVKHIFPFVWR